MTGRPRPDRTHSSQHLVRTQWRAGPLRIPNTRSLAATEQSRLIRQRRITHLEKNNDGQLLRKIAMQPLECEPVSAPPAPPGGERTPKSITQTQPSTAAGHECPAREKGVISSWQRPISWRPGRRFQRASPSAGPQRQYGRVLSQPRSWEFPPWRVVSEYAIHQRSRRSHRSKDALPLVFSPITQ